MGVQARVGGTPGPGFSCEKGAASVLQPGSVCPREGGQERGLGECVTGPPAFGQRLWDPPHPDLRPQTSDLSC